MSKHITSDEMVEIDFALRHLLYLYKEKLPNILIPTEDAIETANINKWLTRIDEIEHKVREA